MSFRQSMGLWAAVLGIPTLSLGAFNYWDATDRTKAPATLSATGVYVNIAAKTLDTSAKYFKVNSALWSDDAAKKRWIILKPGKRIPYNDTADLL